MNLFYPFGAGVLAGLGIVKFIELWKGWHNHRHVRAMLMEAMRDAEKKGMGMKVEQVDPAGKTHILADSEEEE